MAEDLQSLLDKIQKEGIDKATAEAERIVARASAKAEETRAAAEAAAADLRRSAEADATLFQQRAEQAVRQSARNVVLGVEKAVDDTLDRLFLRKTAAALTPEFLQPLIADVVRAYASTAEGREGVEVQLPAAQAAALADGILAAAQSEASAGGLAVRAADDLDSGFRVSLAGGRVEHDFSAEAIAAAMGRFLRPALAALLPAKADR